MMYRFLSDTDKIATPSGQSGWYPMMGWYGNPGYGMMYGSGVGAWIVMVLWAITWILLLAALLVFIRWMWRKGGR